MSQIQITLDRWKNGFVGGPGCLLPIFFSHFLKLLLCVWQGGGSLEAVTESLSKIQITLGKWRNGCVHSTGCLMPKFIYFFKLFSVITLWQCGGVAGPLKCESDTNLMIGSVKA